ncbi:conserved hypothetical protein [Thermotomaculum hydrothermale]|uniref:DUF47 family protein n=1 Tax=Thermotomaculum hydrothermale TaxID=981385 RepID=A0A7R6PZJ6_9BACT|nr:DUF47 family protein [Thermotomaculum hydrothermale]BBB32653.1 conserved hypothetical protein [Thermotomaculum hydrothermale]
MWFLGGADKLQKEIDILLEKIKESASIFCTGIEAYMNKDNENFLLSLEKVKNLESDVDKLRRSIEQELYQKSLIPENRGDVLGLLETLDDIIDAAESTMEKFETEIPDIPAKWHSDFVKLAEKSKDAAFSCVDAASAFFKSVFEVKFYLNKVFLYEKEADRVSRELKRKIFKSDLKQSHKIHLRYFALSIETMSDRAEEVADRLAIYAIKREM